MSENAAITAKDNLRKAIKEGKTQAATIAANVEKIITEGLLEYLNLPGQSLGDKLHALITLPLDQGGLNSQIWEVDALLGITPSVQTKFRNLVHTAKQGERTDLKENKKEEKKVNALIPSAKKKKQGISDSQIAKDRAYTRAAEAIPELDNLLDEGLIDKTTAAKLGGKIKDTANPTEDEQKLMEKQDLVREQLKEIVARPLPESEKERKAIKQEVKKAIEQVTGQKAEKSTITIGSAKATAKAIAVAKPDINYLEELLNALDAEIESLENASLMAA